MRKNREKRSISGLAALVLLGVFSAGILSVLLTGANVYKRLDQQSAVAYDSRVCVQYLSSKIRQAPTSDSVTLSDFGDGDSLRICEQIDGNAYWTQVYCHDGWMMELFSAADADLAPEDGEKILPVQSIAMEHSGDLLQLDVVGETGREHTVLLRLRGGEGASS